MCTSEIYTINDTYYILKKLMYLFEKFAKFDENLKMFRFNLSENMYMIGAFPIKMKGYKDRRPNIYIGCLEFVDRFDPMRGIRVKYYLDRNKEILFSMKLDYIYTALRINKNIIGGVSNVNIFREVIPNNKPIHVIKDGNKLIPEVKIRNVQKNKVIFELISTKLLDFISSYQKYITSKINLTLQVIKIKSWFVKRFWSPDHWLGKKRLERSFENENYSVW